MICVTTIIVPYFWFHTLTKDQRTSVKKTPRKCVSFSFFLGSNSPFVISKIFLCPVLLQAVPFIEGSKLELLIHKASIHTSSTGYPFQDTSDGVPKKARVKTKWKHGMLMRLSLLCTAIEIRNSQISFVFVTVFGIKTLRRLRDILTTNWIQL